jgi:hypothetical protein
MLFEIDIVFTFFLTRKSDYEIELNGLRFF